MAVTSMRRSSLANFEKFRTMSARTNGLFPNVTYLVVAGGGGVVGVEPFEGQLVDGGADAQGLGLFAGAVKVRLVMGG